VNFSFRKNFQQNSSEVLLSAADQEPKLPTKLIRSQTCTEDFSIGNFQQSSSEVLHPSIRIRAQTSNEFHAKSPCGFFLAQNKLAFYL